MISFNLYRFRSGTGQIAYEIRAEKAQPPPRIERVVFGGSWEQCKLLRILVYTNTQQGKYASLKLADLQAVFN